MPSWISGWELVLILVVILVLFGAKKIPEFMQGIGKGLKEFKKATTDIESEIKNSTKDDKDKKSPKA
ncbi:MAG: twin-arginine translocase TatA/TatE family subunit [Ignavibacteria bacterium]|nr:twin-arginine translocase TatA/TatE family subunit [Ignavibacteria bacterium]